MLTFRGRCGKKSENHNVGNVFKKSLYITFLRVSNVMIFTLVVPRLPRKTSIMMDSNVVMCVFAWGVPRFWPKQLSLEIAKPIVIGSFIVNPRRFKLLLFVAGAVFGKPLAPFYCGMRTIWWTLSSIFHGRSRIWWTSGSILSWQVQYLMNL